MAAQISNFASKFPQNKNLAPNFAFLNEHFPTKRFSYNFPSAKNLMWAIALIAFFFAMTSFLAVIVWLF